MEDWICLIRDLGFPIAMCMYFAVINNTTIKQNTEALQELKNVIVIKGGIK